MKKINLAISGCMGRMGKQLIKSANNNRNFKLVSLTENRKINKKISGIRPSINSINAFKKASMIIDFTVPKCTLEILKIAVKQKKKVVIGTTGFTKKEENLIKKFSKKIPILKAGNMSLGVNLLTYLTEIASKSLSKNFLSKIYEVHHRHKKDYPSGTALMLGRGIAIGKNKDFYSLLGKKYLNKKSFPYGKKINFNSLKNQPSEDGKFGEYGGMFVAETLMPLILSLSKNYNKLKKSTSFQEKLKYYQKNYIGRPSPLYFANRITDYCGGAKIFFKRDELNHTGAHKINNVIGQILLAKKIFYFLHLILI